MTKSYSAVKSHLSIQGTYTLFLSCGKKPSCQLPNITPNSRHYFFRSSIVCSNITESQFIDRLY